MRKYVVAIAIAGAFFIDCVLFSFSSISGFLPDVLMAVIVALAVMAGGPIAGLIGFFVGILEDILFNSGIGLSSMGYLMGAFAGGLFFNKFYSDNAIVPAVTAAAVVFAKEHLMLFMFLIKGNNVSSYIMLFASHILPSMILTGGLCALIHLIFKKILYPPLWHKDIDNR